MTSGAARGTVSAPQPLASHHDLSSFNCGVAILDEWLAKRARRNEADGASRTFVAADGLRVLGFYSLAAASVLHRDSIGKVRRNMPDPVPALLLGRLAVDRAWHGKGLGAGLLSDAVWRAIGAADLIGIRAVLVHAISNSAKSFYEKHGFRPSPIDPMMLMITLEEARRMID